MNTEIDIKKLGINDLKALAYDLIAERDRITNNLNVVNKELALRFQNDIKTNKESKK